MKKLISFDEGLALVMKNVPRAEIEICRLENALGRVLAEHVLSPSVSPPFDQSAMDGYAFRFQDWKQGQGLEIGAVIPAGKSKKVKLQKYQCVRIFTGAPLPEGTDTVVMQEKVVVADGKIEILDTQLRKRSNVRLKASHVRLRQRIASKGQRLSAPMISYLASTGIRSVKVLRTATIGVLVTGDELISPGQKLRYGQVFECNTPALVAAIQSVLPSAVVTTYRVKDTASATLKAIRTALKENQWLLITGGVSVGDFDFVLPALKEADVRIKFHKLLQKPGKPVCFGRKNNKIVFGLPGNPASVLSCFYTLVWPALSKQHGALESAWNLVALRNDFACKPGLTQFLKAQVSEGIVEILPDQESYKLNSFAIANALVKIPPQVAGCKSGEQVEVLSLPL